MPVAARRPRSLAVVPRIVPQRGSAEDLTPFVDVAAGQTATDELRDAILAGYRRAARPAPIPTLVRPAGCCACQRDGLSGSRTGTTSRPSIFSKSEGLQV